MSDSADDKAPGRALGVDVGARRVGLAISDPTRTIARPLRTLTVATAAGAAVQVAKEIEGLNREQEPLVTIIVGLPSNLDGTPSEQTARVREFARALADQTTLPIVFVDERLTSREAESRLAIRERDWRKRKERLDAAAAAIILQDYLDQQKGR